MISKFLAKISNQKRKLKLMKKVNSATRKLITIIKSKY
jgi:hypothetical protein